MGTRCLAERPQPFKPEDEVIAPPQERDMEDRPSGFERNGTGSERNGTED
ncbi:MAG: hypothetical protein BJ554DRAFT_5768 [Olpidium bornovanus]|uniref:Uncharacterized protein n=1 Tax=Olpidium bornovanus TaxID=278681 RepID=A0A8H8DKR2_9FUNG|nr:MAG: hypothetical protein BJ554DRAFT_5768 [Olpidium bornovanus]